MRREMPEAVGISVFCPGLVNTGFYASREKAGLEEDNEALKTGEKLMSKGMPAHKAAGAAVEGAMMGEWLIMTHAVAREGAYIAPGCVLMPSFVNIGAYVGKGTMVDTWASIGSCAQIGENCHISAGAGIGGVLEPMQANPTIIGDNCFCLLYTSPSPRDS